MKIAVYTNLGKKRTTNQDYAAYYKNNFQQYLLILCDGVGGHLGGDVASQRTSQFIGNHFEQLPKCLLDEDVKPWFNQVIAAANHEIYRESLENQQLTGMSTTLVLGLIIGNNVHIAHVGDSRAYLYESGHLTQLTEDHSLVNELLQAGEITFEESLIHPHRNALTRSIGGTDEVIADYVNIKLQDQASLLMLCSDGLTNMLNFDTLQAMFKKEAFAEDFGNQLIEAANEAGGKDNISVIVVTQLLKENFKGEEVSKWK